MSMNILFDPSGDLQCFRDHIQTLLDDANTHTILVLACDENAWSQSIIDPILTQASKPILGGIFPQIVFKTEHYQRGSLCIGLNITIDYCLLTGLSNINCDTDNELRLEQASARWHRKTKGTLMVVADGLSTRISALLDILFDHFALDKNIFGGGAGSLNLTQQPCIITPEGLLADAALLVNVPRNSTIGVAHGWQAISGSYKVTQSDRNVIRTLNWRPALEVYKEVVEEHMGRHLDKDDFFSTSKAYPFGIQKLSNEMIVRDPISIDANNGLTCVGEVPEGSFVRILHGDADCLINAAASAKAAAAADIHPSLFPQVPVIILVDCISRALFLESRMTDELQAVAGKDDTLMMGALTLGEIANSGNDYLDFFNKTCVVCLMEDSDG